MYTGGGAGAGTSALPEGSSSQSTETLGLWGTGPVPSTLGRPPWSVRSPARVVWGAEGEERTEVPAGS